MLQELFTKIATYFGDSCYSYLFSHFGKNTTVCRCNHDPGLNRGK